MRSGVSQLHKRDRELSPCPSGLHRPGVRAAIGDTEQGCGDRTSAAQHSCGTVDELAAPGGRGAAGVAVGSPGLPGPSTPHSSLKGWARQVPALPPAPHARLPWGRQAFTQPARRSAKEGQGCSQCKGAARPAGAGKGKHHCFVRCRSCVCSQVCLSVQWDRAAREE